MTMCVLSGECVYKQEEDDQLTTIRQVMERESKPYDLVMMNGNCKEAQIIRLAQRPQALAPCANNRPFNLYRGKFWWGGYDDIHS